MGGHALIELGSGGAAEPTERGTQKTSRCFSCLLLGKAPASFSTSSLIPAAATLATAAQYWFSISSLHAQASKRTDGATAEDRRTTAAMLVSAGASDCIVLQRPAPHTRAHQAHIPIVGRTCDKRVVLGHVVNAARLIPDGRALFHRHRGFAMSSRLTPSMLTPRHTHEVDVTVDVTLRPVHMRRKIVLPTHVAMRSCSLVLGPRPGSWVAQSYAMMVAVWELGCDASSR